MIFPLRVSSAMFITTGWRTLCRRPAFCFETTVERAANMGLDYSGWPELEFSSLNATLRQLDPLKPHDQAGYFDVSTDLAHSVRRQMVDELQSMGSMVEARTTKSPLVKRNRLCLWPGADDGG